MTVSKKTSVATILARLAPPLKNDGEALATITAQQIASVMACSDYPNQPTVQAIVGVLKTDNTALETTLAALAQAYASIPPLEAARNAQIATVRRDRHNLGGALTAICGGVPSKITAWGAVVSEPTATPNTTDAPATPTATPSATTPGTVNGKTPSIPGAASYFWSLSVNPAVPAAGTAPVVSTGTRVSIPGQTAGSVMYLRVAVVRRHGGPSAWSEAAQVTVR